MTDLPPMNAVRVFEVVCRHGSFSKAAVELRVTPAAVGQQVRLLEEWLGTPLFRRESRRLILNDAGGLYRTAIQSALVSIRNATENLLDFEKAGGSLIISSQGSFASNWLLPRLPAFRAIHPEVRVVISSAHNFLTTTMEDLTDRVWEFTQLREDISLRNGKGEWPGMTAEKIADDRAFPVCSPALAAGDGDRPPLRTPEDLVHHHLLNDILPEGWSDWLNAVAPSVHGLKVREGVTFSHSYDVVKAAVHGHGVAIGHEVLVAEDLAAGRLVAPFEESIPSAHGYYLVYPDGALRSPRVRRFRDWLMDEAVKIPAGANLSQDGM